MAGTHAISYALKGRYVIYANDIQQYSAVIGKALVENNAYLKVTEEDIVKLLQYMQENLSELESQKSMIKSNQYISFKTRFSS
jgi:adenine-specific DNA methylase